MQGRNHRPARIGENRRGRSLCDAGRMATARIKTGSQSQVVGLKLGLNSMIFMPISALLKVSLKCLKAIIRSALIITAYKPCENALHGDAVRIENTGLEIRIFSNKFDILSCLIKAFQRGFFAVNKGDNDLVVTRDI